jgi:dTMP kinase
MAALGAWLRAGERAVTETQEPGGTAIGQEIRRVLLDPSHAGMSPIAELLLYEASRAQLVTEVIRPALDRGEIVLCDRFTDSTVAYQGYGRGLDLALIERLNRLAAATAAPDCTFLLDLDPAVGLARVRERTPADRMEAQVLAFHQRVREGFLTVAGCQPERVAVLDATRPAEEIWGRVRDRVAELLDARAVR